MRLLYYAMGGGLGHLVRARAFLHTQQLTHDAVVLTASEFVRDARVVAGLEWLVVPNSLAADVASFRRWLLRELERLNIECLCVDSFPAGILGELCDFPLPDVRLWHVARLLRWGAYTPLLRGRAPRFERCWQLETLSPEHAAFLAAHCQRTEMLTLVDAPSPPCAAGALREPYWLIAHSGPSSEVSELIAYASELRAAEALEVPLWVASLDLPAQLPAATFALDVYPAHHYFASAQRIITAAGYNSMRHAEPYRAKHTVLPMLRRFDDQFERARRARTRPVWP